MAGTARLKGKTAVVTGAGSGIGRAASLLFAREGAEVACVDIDAAWGNETVALIRQQGGQAAFFRADLSQPADIEAMARDCMAWRDRIHVLFNNAGILVPGDIANIRLEDWQRHLAVNLTAPYLCSLHLLPALKAAQGASIIHNGSIDGPLGNHKVAAYSVSKGGLTPLTHVMAHTFGPFRIRVNCVNPGGISRSAQGIPVRLTDPSGTVQPMSEAMRKATPLGRPGLVEEVASVALFLASDESAYVNGSTITVDGGRTGLTQGHT